MEKGTIYNPGKTFWRDAARDGAVIGVLLLVCTLIDELTRPALGLDGELYRQHTIGVMGVVKFVIMVGCIYIFTRRRSLCYGSSGFTFSQSMGYIVVMMAFAGFFTGIGDYLTVNVISPEYYGAALEKAIDMHPLQQTLDPDIFERSREIAVKIMRSPLYFIVTGMFGKIIYGGPIGLFVSALVKRAPVKRSGDEQ